MIDGQVSLFSISTDFFLVVPNIAASYSSFPLYNCQNHYCHFHAIIWVFIHLYYIIYSNCISYIVYYCTYMQTQVPSMESYNIRGRGLQIEIICNCYIWTQWVKITWSWSGPGSITQCSRVPDIVEITRHGGELLKYRISHASEP